MAVRAAEKGRRGVYRLANSTTFRLRRQLPGDVREAIGRREWDISLRTDSAVEADRLATDQHAIWDREIDRARRGALAPVDMNAVRRSFAVWSDFSTNIDRVEAPTATFIALDTRPAPYRRDYAGGRSRELTTPGDVASRISALQAACETGRFDVIPAFRAALDAALAHQSLSITDEHPLWPEVQAAFGEALLAHLIQSEQHRLIAAARHQQAAVASTTPIALLPSIADAAKRPTLRMLIDAYRAEREAKHGKESTDRKYAHLFRALEEVLDLAGYVDELKRAECRRIRDFLRRVPTHSGKLYRGKSLAEAIDLADASEAEVTRLSQNTVNSYLANLIAMLSFAVREEWISTNPASGLVEKGRAVVRRRGFTPDELTKAFADLTGWHRWFFAILLYSGARAGEIAQLRRGDVREADGLMWLSLEEFDEAGRRVATKRLKTRESMRVVPLHKELVRLGLPAFLTAANDPAARVFSDVRETADGYTHELSKWWARHLDRAGMSEPALTMHSFRHGFRDAGRRAGLDPTVIDALGGWASRTVGDRYGDRTMVEVLKRDLDKIEYGSFAVR